MKPKYGRGDSTSGLSRKPTKREEERRIFAYIGKNLYDHAFTCEYKMCVCRASSFNDALAELLEVDKKKYKREVKEIWNRDKDETNRR